MIEKSKSLTVAELIEKLSKLPPDAEVIIPVQYREDYEVVELELKDGKVNILACEKSFS